MLTYNCNLRCKMCPFWKRKTKDISLDKIKQSILLIKKLGVTMIAFEGGEPLLRKGIGEILSFSRNSGLSTSLITNGVLLESKKDEIIPGINGVVFVSIDGLEKTHDKIRGVKGTFKKAINGILACRDKVLTCINTTITDDNVEEIEEIVKLAKDLDTRFSVEVAVEYRDADVSLPESSRLVNVINNLIKMKKEGYPIINSFNYLRVIKGSLKWTCRPWMVINIDPNGKVILPCYVYHEYKSDININDSNLVNKWRSYDWDKLKECNKCNLHCYVEPSLIFSFDISTFNNWRPDKV